MQLVEIELGPPWPSFSTFGESIVAAGSQPEQEKAKRHTEVIAGSTLEAGHFGRSRCVLQFSNDWYLLAQAREFHVEWIISQGDPPSIKLEVQRRIRSAESGREWNFDPSSMIARILGSELIMLRVTGRAFLVYTRGNDIFWLEAYRECGTQRDFLHAVFET